jgi:hypothetical protein
MLWQLIVGIALLFLGLLKLMAAGIFFSVLMIVLGIQFIFGFAAWPFSHECDANSNTLSQRIWFGHAHYNPDAATVKTKQLIEYKTVFASSKIDFSQLSEKEFAHTPVVVNIDTVLGKTELHLNKNVPVRIFAKAAIGKTILPDGTSISMGSAVYSNLPEQQPLMIINCSTALSAIEIFLK